ncbi:MAG: hypothetical protein GX949_02150 [Peptococcaceae bacterium]|nr:hypothetical protein [Peptococcaceae bacterium]
MLDNNETIRINNQRIIEEWVEALGSLIKQVKQWIILSPYNERFNAVDLMVNKFEEPVGDYQAPMLILTTDKTPIEVLPVGRFAIGAIGRVDITNHKQSYSILYSKKRGWISLDKRKPLDEEIFMEILEHLSTDGGNTPELH